MKTPQFEPGGIKEIRIWEHVIRFLYGGIVTVITGLIAQRWGPWVGGLFLAFPAILPATLTLVKKHDGRQKACDDARGARLGAIGLITFALVVALGASHLPPALTLAFALGAWIVVSVLAWLIAG